MPTISGLSTGIDTSSIVKELLQIRQTRINVLTAQKADVANQQSAFKGIEGDIISLKSQASSLARSVGNVFDTRKASSSNEDILTATATTSAATGVYQVKVTSLAQAHQIASQGFSDADSEISQGTFTLKAGGNAETTITVDGTNNTLQGLADSINAAGVGISASIVEDSSSPSARFKLVLTSGKTGTANAIQITNNLAATSGTATQPTFDLNNPVQAATDAVVQLGTGSGAVTATSSTNTVNTLISGVTLNLKQADTTKMYAVTVQRDTAGASTAVQNFVDAYNKLTGDFATNFSYATDTQKAGILLGNSSASGLQDTIRASVLGTVAGVNPLVNRLSAIGVSVQDDGTLAFDATKLQNVLSGQTSGVSPDDARRLFALDGKSSNAGIQFLLGSTKTGTPAGGVQVDITQAAQRASLTATSALGPSIVIDGSNDTLSVQLDGKTATNVKLAHGTYTQDSLASELESEINNNSNFTGRESSVGVSGGKLTIRSETFGSTSAIAVTGGTAASILGFSGTESGVGKDVAGKFIVDGKEEPATGSGRLLTGSATNANTADLQIRVTLTDSQVQAGNDGQITMTRGIASTVDQTLGKLLDSTNGRIKFVDDEFDAKIKDLQKTIDSQNQIFDKQQQSLNDQFTALETTMSTLQSTASYLTQQLAGLSG